MLFFLSRKINIRAHVDQGEKDTMAKLRNRSLKTLDEAYSEMYRGFREPRLLGMSLGSAASTVTVASPSSPQARVTSLLTSSIESQNQEPAIEALIVSSFPEETSPVASAPHSPGALQDPLSLLEEEDAMNFENIEDNLYSEVFTTQQEKDERGRLIKPRRQVNPTPVAGSKICHNSALRDTKWTFKTIFFI